MVERNLVENPYEVARVKDQKFIYDIFYEKTEANSLVVDAIREFIENPDYANLRQKHVPELYQDAKELRAHNHSAKRC